MNITRYWLDTNICIYIAKKQPIRHPTLATLSALRFLFQLSSQVEWAMNAHHEK